MGTKASTHLLSTPVVHDDETEYFKKILALWLDNGLKKPGLTNAALAQRLKVGATEISKMRAGTRKILAAQLYVIADYIEEPIPMADEPEPDGIAIPVIGEAGRPAWFDTDPVESPGIKLPYVPESRYGSLPHFATKVVGGATARRIPDGMYAVYVPYWSARKALTDRDFILFKHVHPSGMHKRLIRQVRVLPDRFELRNAAGTEKEDAEVMRLADDLVHFDGIEGQMELIGLVVWQCGPV